MCGIVGFIGQNTESVLIRKLKQLEYRGYDSAGICTKGSEGIKVFKSKGEIINLERIVKEQTDSYLGIGHTRWATHGKPDEINAHPHISSNKKWIIVHNGIIENYQELKDKLSKLGFSFYSETDTEVIAKLLEYYSGINDTSDKLTIIENVCQSLCGSYAIAIISADENKIFFAKNKSPLFVSVNGKSIMLASDVICFKDFSSEYYEIVDGEFGYIEKDKLVCKNNLGIVEKLAQSCDFGNVDTENNYQHFMIKEIYETKNAVKNIYEYYSSVDYAKKLEEKQISKVNRIKLVGCGTAYHACQMGAKILEQKLNLDCVSYVASEFRYSPPIIDENTLVIFISQSGETADTIAGLELAKQKNARTLALVNVEYSTLAKNVDLFLPIKAGVEIAVASTKAYSSQLVVLYILSELLGKVILNQEVSLQKVKDLYDNFDYGNDNTYKLLADIFQYNEKLFMIGRGTDYMTALEASLKIKETSYINSDTYYAGELKHGFLALIDSKTYVVVFATDEKVLSKTLANAEEARARGAKIILFTCLDLKKNETEKYFYVIKINKASPPLQCVYNIVPWQLIAYYTSINKGINPDKPRNLAKSVTVE